MKHILFIIFIFIQVLCQSFSFASDFSLDRSFESSDKPFFYCKENHLISAYLRVYDEYGNYSNRFEIITQKDSILYIPDYNFINFTNEKGSFSLVKFSFSFLQLKFNVIPYLQAPALIKFLYLMDKVRFMPRVSDAMRTNENQLKYKRRGWSNIESSPHIIGAAMDLSYATREDKEKILSLNEQINIHYLEHGRGGNRHVHLQDNSIWNMDVSTYANALSENLSNEIIVKDNMVTSTCLPVDKVTSDENTFNYNFTSEHPEILKIKILDEFDRVKGKLSCGVFEKGNHSLTFYLNFLKRGVYKLIIQRREGFLEEKIVVVL